MKLKWKWALLVSTLFSLIICWPAILGGKVFYFGDNFHLIIPQKIFLVQQIQQGVFPFWNPYTLGGMPFFADVNQAIFYPSTVFFLLFPIATALTLTVFSHLIIAGLGQYFFSKTLHTSDFAAFCSMALVLFSQPILMSINHVNIILLQVITWLPWILGLFILSVRDGNKKAALSMPVFVSLAILGGHPQPILYLVIPGFMYFLFFPKNIKNIRLLILAAVMSFLLTACITIPFMELFQASTRSEMGAKETLNDSVSPAHLVDLLIPNFFSNPSIGMRWGIYWIDYRRAGLYITWIGLLAIVLTIFCRKQSKEMNWVIASAFTVLTLALGKNLPLLPQIIEIIGILQSIRNYSLILILFPMLAGVISGVGIETLLKKPYRRLLIVASLLLVASLLFYLITHQIFDSLWNTGLSRIPQIKHSTFHTYERDKVILEQISTTALYSATFFFLILLSASLLPKRIWSFVVVGLLVIDMYRAAKPILVFGNKQVYEYQNNPILEHVSSLDTFNYRIVSGSGFFAYSSMPDYWANSVVQSPFAKSSVDMVEKETNSQLIDRRNVFGSNWNIPNKLMSPFGTATFVLRETAKYWKNTTSDSYNINEVDNPDISDSRLTDQGVRYVIVDKTVFEKGLPQSLSKLNIVHNNDKWIIYEISGARPIIRLQKEAGLVTLLPSSVNNVVFKANTPTTNFALVKVANYPGWKCTLDSQPCLIEPDGFTMKIAVPEGEHVVKIEFVPNGWPLILYVSGISWIGYLLVLRRFAK